MERITNTVRVVLVLFLVGCSKQGAKRVEPHWARAMEGHELVATSLEYPGSPNSSVELNDVPDSHERCFENRGVQACIHDVRYGFWLDLTNSGHRPIRLLWNEGRYIDETGQAHVIYHHESVPDYPTRPNQSPTTVGPAQSVKVTVAPGYKTYDVVSDSGDQHVFHEPLVPSRLDDKNEQQMRAYVADLTKRHVPVKLILPIEIEEKRYDYTFSFALRNRWADSPKQ